MQYIYNTKEHDTDEVKALVFDAHYDTYRGVISYVRVVSGILSKRQKIRYMSTNITSEILDLGFFTPKMTSSDAIGPGEVGYVISNIKNVNEAEVGDTITDANTPAKEALPGYKEAKPMVFCGFYPVDTQQYTELKDVLGEIASPTITAREVAPALLLCSNF